MLVSILHRITGDGLAIVGLGVFLWWLGAAAAGETTYQDFATLAGSPVGIVMLVGLTWAGFNHLLSGIRHFVLDIGAGYELDENKAWSVASLILGVALTIGFWALVLGRQGAL